MEMKTTFDNDVRDIVLRIMIAARDGRGSKLTHDECMALASTGMFTDLAGPVDTSVQPRVRAFKARYEFWKVRGGDAVTLKTPYERLRFMSAWSKWIKHRPGTLRATSRRDGEGYIVTFSGISPAEVTEARLARKDDI